MNVNRHILITTVVILAGGIVQQFSGKGAGYTRTIVGALLFMLILSLIDVFGGPASTLASALAMVTLVYVALDVFLPAFFKLPGISQLAGNAVK